MKHLNTLTSNIVVILWAWSSVPMVQAAVKQLPADPTRPKISIEATTNNTTKAKTWVLQSIRTGQDSRNAVINGKLLTEGQNVSSGVVLSKINSASVVLNNNGKRQVLTLQHRDIKHTSYEN